jgi:hypothetical protein
VRVREHIKRRRNKMKRRIRISRGGKSPVEDHPIIAKENDLYPGLRKRYHSPHEEWQN